jgi:hypothetical protein
LLFDGKQITEVAAAAIDAQFAVPSVGYLLVLSWDAPDEATPWLLLLDESFRPLDRHEFGGFFAAGATRFAACEVEKLDQIMASFARNAARCGSRSPATC